MIFIRVEDLEPFLRWLETCPVTYSITSMSGGYAHVKFMLQTTSQKADV